MLSKSNKARGALLASAAALTALAQPAAAQTDAAQGNGEIVVTAQKREQTLQEIPQSISVVSGEMLEQRQARSLQDYAAMIPGLSFEQNSPGNARVILRGINTGSVSATVSVYVDDIPFGSSSGLVNGGVLAGDFDTFDISRLEVLRGPQGTLYGASSLGGVLKFVTNAPKLGAFEVRARAGAETVKGGDTSYNANLVANLPVGDRAAIRASGYYRRIGGYVDAIGTAGSRQFEDINGAEIYGGRISALIEPTDSLTLRLTALAQNIDAKASSGVEADPATLEPLYGGLTRTQFVPDFTNTHYRIYSGELGWDLGGAELKSISSYATLHRELEVDNTYLANAIGYGLDYCPATIPTCDFISFQSNVIKKFTQEVRIASLGKSTIDWLVGGYYTRETGELDQALSVIDPASRQPVPGAFGTLTIIGLDSRYREYAVFGNATWNVTDRFDITVGGRYSRNEQVGQQTVFQLGSDIPFEQLRSSDNVFTYSVAPRFELSQNVSLYARAAKGYRPGGPNMLPIPLVPGVPTEFADDSTMSYEAGVKAKTADNSFSIDASAFYIDWTDIQLFQVVNSTGVNTNGGTAVSKGFEVSATLRPTAGLEFTANGSYTDAYLTEDAGALVGGFKGDRLPYVPKVAVNLSGDYRWALAGDTEAFVGGTVSLVGPQSPDFDFSYRTANGRQRRIPSYETVDLRAGVDFGRVSVEAFARNLTNSRGIVNMAGFGTLPNGAISTVLIRPRSFGLSLALSY